MRTSHVLALVVGLVLGATLVPSRAQDETSGHLVVARFDVGAIDQAARAAGLPVVSVRCRDGRCEVVLDKTSTPTQQVEAEAIANAADRGDATLTLSGGRTLELRPAPALTLIDALAVLAVEPDDKAARAVVEARAAQVKEGR